MIVVVLLAVLLVVWVVGYYTLSPSVLGNWNRNQMESLRSDLPLGLTRTEAYARIRAHRQIAINPYYDRWTKQPDGTYLDEGYRQVPHGFGGPSLEKVESIEEWPTPAIDPPGHRVPKELWYAWAWPNDEHPWVEIQYDMGSHEVFCTNTMNLRIDFDRSERISQVSEQPQHECYPP